MTICLAKSLRANEIVEGMIWWEANEWPACWFSHEKGDDDNNNNNNISNNYNYYKQANKQHQRILCLEPLGLPLTKLNYNYLTLGFYFEEDPEGVWAEVVWDEKLIRLKSGLTF